MNESDMRNLQDLAESHARLVRVGMEAAEERFYSAVRAVDRGYRQAAIDPQTKIPSYLMAAIHNLVAMLPPTETALAKDNDYANEMVKRDQLDRLEGR